MRVGTLRFNFFLLLLTIVTLSFLGLVWGFIMPLFWATVLAVIFRPTHDRLTRRLGGRESLSSVLTVGLIILVVLIPLGFVAVALVNEASHIFQRINSGEATIMQVVYSIEQELPAAREFLLRFGVTAERVQEGITNTAVAISQASGRCRIRRTHWRSPSASS